MRLYVVGAPESFYELESSSLLKAVTVGVKINPRTFSQVDIEANLKSLAEVRLFTSVDEASDYARTLRICRASHIPDPSRKKIAPVVHLDLPDTLIDKYLKCDVKSETVNYTVYAGAHNNFPNRDDNRKELTQEKQVNYRSVPISDFNCTDFKFVCVELPDSGIQVQNFSADATKAEKPGRTCALL